jgi:hypothetical protein
MPSAIAIKMYWVNLFDIPGPPSHLPATVCHIKRTTQQACPALLSVGEKNPLWNAAPPNSLIANYKNCAIDRFIRGDCIKERQSHRGEMP